ncbi:MAG: hypothetical protein ACE5GE_13170 [Phycisphaerae bacterium]
MGDLLVRLFWILVGTLLLPLVWAERAVHAIGRPRRQPATPGSGRIVILPGIEGGGWPLRGMVKGLLDAGIRADITVEPWASRSWWMLGRLMNLDANRQLAERLAAKLADLRHRYPDEPITLIGLSGGAGLAVLVAEALPADVQLDRMVLIGAAISPRRDLAAALKRCRNGLLNFYSQADWLFLGLGTLIFGTIDRCHTFSAGLTGWRGAGDEAARGAVHQIPWKPAWLAVGHHGGHLGWLSRGWARSVLARELTRPAPNQPSSV